MILIEIDFCLENLELSKDVLKNKIGFELYLKINCF